MFYLLSESGTRKNWYQIARHTYQILVSVFWYQNLVSVSGTYVMGIRGNKHLKWLTWRGHAHFRDCLSSVGWDLLCSTHVLHLKCLRLHATKKWKATPNVKILVLSHPLGDLGVTHRVHQWLDGKRVVDFLLAIIAILASSHGCGTIKRNRSKSAFSAGGGSLWAPILGRWGRHPQSFYGALDRGMM